jgi:hypothetical protein
MGALVLARNAGHRDGGSSASSCGDRRPPRWDRRARDAEAELLRRFPREVVSLERLMLHAMRTRAEERRIAWPKALMADAAARDSTDFKNLLRLAAEAAPRVAKEVLALRQPALLTRPGLIARTI